MSVQRAWFEITSTEFMDWVVYLDNEETRFHKEDYYLANIAAEMRRSYVKEPVKVKTEDFLLRFEEKDKSRKSSAMSIKKEKTEKAKTYWMALMGIAKGKK